MIIYCILVAFKTLKKEHPIAGCSFYFVHTIYSILDKSMIYIAF